MKSTLTRELGRAWAFPSPHSNLGASVTPTAKGIMECTLRGIVSYVRVEVVGIQPVGKTH